MTRKEVQQDSKIVEVRKKIELTLPRLEILLSTSHRQPLASKFLRLSPSKAQWASETLQVSVIVPVMV